mmetsp:Transcript_102482/g.161927  ORF Transcript_102482/g.161927 Transcript_102482/m.161927 type:complete len:209 (-) Transcript_102482:339-965(-)
MRQTVHTCSYKNEAKENTRVEKSFRSNAPLPRDSSNKAMCSNGLDQKTCTSCCRSAISCSCLYALMIESSSTTPFKSRWVRILQQTGQSTEVRRSLDRTFLNQKSFKQRTCTFALQCSSFKPNSSTLEWQIAQLSASTDHGRGSDAGGGTGFGIVTMPVLQLDPIDIIVEHARLSKDACSEQLSSTTASKTGSISPNILLSSSSCTPG